MTVCIALLLINLFTYLLVDNERCRRHDGLAARNNGNASGCRYSISELLPTPSTGQRLYLRHAGRTNRYVLEIFIIVKQFIRFFH